MVLEPRSGAPFRVTENCTEVRASVSKSLGRTKFSGQPAVGDSGPSEDLRAQRRRELQTCVSWLLESTSASQFPIEKRSQRRFSYRKPITVTPVSNATGRPDQFKSFPAFGIDISSTGMCFLARQLVPVRRAVLSMEGPGDRTVAILFEPRWVRFTRGGWYQTGGRLLEVLHEEKDAMPIVRLMEPPADLFELCEKSRHS